MTSNDAPHKDLGEITLIGTGGGYGESSVIHLGNDHWCIIDSCINPKTKENLSLSYLNKIGINLLNVRLIVCTHWHDDHILGISNILDLCKNADFSFARASDLQKFLQFINLDYLKVKKKPSNSSTSEFTRCLKLLISRNKQPKWAGQDRTLWTSLSSSMLRNEIISLSPSDLTMSKFDTEISTLISDYGPAHMRIVANSPNSKSIVLYIKMGHHRALMGADLEVSQDKGEGWDNILLTSCTIDKKASLFKIPHHGSKNGYHLNVWDKLLKNESVAKLTPWNKNNKLPEAEMIQKYLEHTNMLFITSPKVNLKPKKRHPNVEKLLKQLNSKVSEVKFDEGLIRSRIEFEDPNASWIVDTFSNAFKIV